MGDCGSPATSGLEGSGQLSIPEIQHFHHGRLESQPGLAKSLLSSIQNVKTMLYILQQLSKSQLG